MRFRQQRNILAALALGCILTALAGCASKQPAASPPAKPPVAVQAMVDVQKVLEAHPLRGKLRQMEQELAAADAKAAADTSAQDTARQEFETAMKVRQDEDKAALEKKQTQLGDELTEQRRAYIEELEKEYRPLLFNIDLKLKTVQITPAEKETLQKEMDRLLAERQQKLKAKEDELAARFKKEMDAFAAELAQKTDAYAQQWTEERMKRLQQDAVSPEREQQRRAIVELSNRMIADVRATVTKVALRDKIEVVWLRQAVHTQLKDITDTVAKELASVK
jgi:Skp family chaperone for outer membrane proteins